VVALAGAYYVLKLHNSGSSDPGCKAYASTALPAYNNAVDVLNKQAAQSTLSADMTTAVTDLTSAAQQAQSTAAKSALNTMLAQLKSVQTDVAAGSVPTSVVTALNADAATADNVCS
jgi:FixJ family two-component response regulator